MRYLVIMRELYECDNNTPSDKVWVKIEDFKNEHEKDLAEKNYIKEQVKDEAFDTEITFIPLEKLNDWQKALEIW